MLYGVTIYIQLFFIFYHSVLYILSPRQFYIYLRQFIIDFIDFKHKFDEI